MTKTDVVDLDSSNFDSIALDKTKDVLVEFYAPCKNTQCLLFLIFLYVIFFLLRIIKMTSQDADHITLEVLSQCPRN